MIVAASLVCGAIGSGCGPDQAVDERAVDAESLVDIDDILVDDLNEGTVRTMQRSVAGGRAEMAEVLNLLRSFATSSSPVTMDSPRSTGWPSCRSRRLCRGSPIAG